MSATEQPSATEPNPPTDARHDRYAALRFRDFRLLVAGRFVTLVGGMMVSVAVGWELYERTRARRRARLGCAGRRSSR